MHNRNNPFYSKIKERILLNPGSTKETFHLALKSDLPFKVGDSIGVLPENDSSIVDAILTILPELDPDFLLKKANLCKCNSSLLKLLQSRGAQIDFLEDKPKLLDFLNSHHLIDILQAFPSSVSGPELASCLMPLMPRFYSIASSSKMYPHEIHLTVASLTYNTISGPHKGIGSHFLCRHAKPMITLIPIYVQPSNGFTLPEDPNASIILIGPGTGIAPFRAFLQERTALQHPGRSWLFFGERNKATDFYYAEYFLELEKQGRLRLDLAFSRDSSEKTYVQHKLWENRASIWNWLQKGATLFVCGDAEKMAKDVDLTLQRIGQDAGLIEEDARSWLKTLRKNRKYLADVY